jgi:ribosomal protein S18 acetylase RimI-like enzyme
MSGGDHLSASLRELVTELGIERLAVTNLVHTDLGHIAWSGSPAHVRHVAKELDRVACGDAEYLAVRLPAGTPIAKGGIDFGERPGAGVIHQVATHPDLRGLGIGSRLVAAAEARIRARGLTMARLSVEHDNPRARTLYERLGYVRCGECNASWEAQREDGSMFTYETVLTDMEKAL